MWFVQICSLSFELEPPPPPIVNTVVGPRTWAPQIWSSGVSLKSLHWPCVNRTPSQKLRPNLIFAGFQKGMGSPVRREGDLSGQNTFSNIGPRTKIQHSAVAISQIWFLWTSLMTMIVLQRQHGFHLTNNCIQSLADGSQTWTMTV